MGSCLSSEDKVEAGSNGKNPEGWVLEEPTGNLKDHYRLGEKIGEGQFGVTKMAHPKHGNGPVLACKTISKSNVKFRQADRDDVRREISILKTLGDYEHIVQLKAVFEDTKAIHLVQELCTGGELFDRIINKGRYSEADAARIMHTMCKVVSHCHANGVIHRDLKPENFLFKTNLEEKDPTAIDPLMAIDFGLSVHFKPGQVFHEACGSPYYIAPEVLRKKYGPECDVWSLGVIMYILLTGEPPFAGDTTQAIFESVMNGTLKMSKLRHISDDAKKLLQRMLTRDVKERITAVEAINHAWLADKGEGLSTKPLDLSVLQSLKRFDAASKFRKLVLIYMSSQLSTEDLQQLQAEFNEVDADGNGVITYDELQRVLEKQGQFLSREEIEKLLEGMDMDGNGCLKYEDWIAATLRRRQIQDESALHKAFEHFDTDHSGFITSDNLREIMKDSSPEEIDSIVKQVDTNGDGNIDYSEFAHLMASV